MADWKRSGARSRSSAPNTRGPNSGYQFAAFLGLIEGLENSGIGGAGISVSALAQYLEGADTNAVDTVRESTGYKAGRAMADIIKVAASDSTTRVYCERLMDALDGHLDRQGPTADFVTSVASESAGFVDDVSSFFGD